MCWSAVAALPALAKEGVVAILQTPAVAYAPEGNLVVVRWSLVNESTREAFSACSVFVRLTGRDGERTEGFSDCPADAGSGNYEAIVRVPPGGIRQIQIGIAGTATDDGAGDERSAWLIALRNDPIGE